MFAELMKLMEYVEPTVCCKNCRYFVPTDCSGKDGSKSRHCRFNPAVEMPVEEDGKCKYFDKAMEKSFEKTTSK